MKEFLQAALPWVCIGLSLAVVVVNHVRRKQAKEHGSNAENSMLVGMVIGMALGYMVDSSTGVSYGMLLGMVIGMCIPRKKK